MSRGFTVSGGMNVSVAGTPPGVVSVARKANRVCRLDWGQICLVNVTMVSQRGAPRKVNSTEYALPVYVVGVINVLFRA